jgi:hypothetical protein
MLAAGHKLGIKKNKYTPRNILGLSENEAMMYYRTVFADEFIEYLFIWNDFIEYIAELGEDLKDLLNGKSNISKSNLLKLDLVQHIETWGKENKFDADTMLKVITARDDLIGDLLNIGMNPFYNGMGLQRGTYNLVELLRDNLPDGIAEIAKIKKCIYEGYRMNLYIWNDGLKEYISPISHNSVTIDTKVLKPVTLDDDIKQARAQKIIVSGVTLRQGQSTDGLYEFMGADVSVLDGFVDVDIDFTM